jgi:molecular chaperone DnaK (HSP70)
MSKYVFGIDLGTTYSCISYVDEAGKPIIIKNSEGKNTTPSVVFFENESNTSVGQIAKDAAIVSPDKTISLVKTLMGKVDFVKTVYDKDYSPEEISSLILTRLTGDAAKALNTEVKDVVITCPAYFGTAERTATTNAGIMAGLNVLEIISEPTAAALFYGSSREVGNKNILVYDLGGGTFDVTIMRMSENKIEVIFSVGDHDLGGKNWDKAIIDYLEGEFRDETNYDEDIDEQGYQHLSDNAEKAKISLSQREEVPVTVQIKGLIARIPFSRENFNSLTEGLLKQTIDKTNEAIEGATRKNPGFKVDLILLVGGSTRMPQVEEKLKQEYPDVDILIFEPDEAVAKGAAIHAVNVYVEKRDSLQEWDGVEGSATEPKIDNPEDYKEELSVRRDMISGSNTVISNSTTKSYALQIVKDGEDKCFNIIIKNNPMPDGSVCITKPFGTNVDNQKDVLLQVYENDFEDEYFDVDRDYFLGDATLELPGNLPRGSDIDVTFTLNNEGKLDVTGRDVTSGKEIKVTMYAKGIMTKEQVEEGTKKVQALTVI